MCDSHLRCGGWSLSRHICDVWGPNVQACQPKTMSNWYRTNEMSSRSFSTLRDHGLCMLRYSFREPCQSRAYTGLGPMPVSGLSSMPSGVAGFKCPFSKAVCSCLGRSWGFQLSLEQDILQSVKGRYRVKLKKMPATWLISEVQGRQQCTPSLDQPASRERQARQERTAAPTLWCIP